MIVPQGSYAAPGVDGNLNQGYTPQIGPLISMLDWVSDSEIRISAKLTVEQLDYLHDKDSNTIGSPMLHLAAIGVVYQDTAFNSLEDFAPANKTKWQTAMELGENARKEIKGHR